MNHTLQLKRPFGRTLLLAALILIGLSASSEVVARTTFFQQVIVEGAARGPVSEFAIKLSLLQTHRNQSGPLDCILVGNSVSQWAFDTPTLTAAYQSQTGQPLNCFNFSIDGIHPQTVAPLIQFLSDQFHPHLIIYGLNDWFSNLSYPPQGDPIVDTPWFQYQIGHPTLAGWLSVHSYAYRYLPNLLEWLNPPSLSTPLPRPESFNATGDPLTDDLITNIDLTQPPDPIREEAWFHDVANYQLPPPTLDAFAQIAAIRSTQILIVEIPTHPTYALYYPNGLAGKTAALQQIRNTLTSRNIPYWSTQTQPAIPDTAWQDRVHLRRAGAYILSTWLGQQLASQLSNNLTHPLPP